MNKILVADSLPANILAQYNQTPGIEIDNRAGISIEELQQVLPQYDGLVVRSRTRVTAELLENAGQLKVIGRAGAGVDNIDTAEATRRGIIVMNTPGGNTVAAAEHTVAMMLATLRNIPQAHGTLKDGKWDRKTYLGNELFEKTVGVIGLGKIGREVAKRLKSFGTRLIGYDPILTSEVANRLGIELVDLETLFAEAEIITVHVPKMPKTINLINSETLAKCRDGVILVNCARGGIVNEADTLAALDSGKVATAAFDVFNSEPPTDWALIEHPRVVATPHLGASTEEAQAKVAGQIFDQMIEFFEKKVAINAVNFIAVDERLQPIIGPYYRLAEHLGTLYSGIRSGRLKEVAIRFYGDIIKLPLEPIASHLLVGALKAGRDDQYPDVDVINMVNAMAVAREKGISLEISRKDKALTSHTNLIACDFHTDEGMIHLSATIYAKDIYRLVEFGDYLVDANLTESMVIVENDDVPGIIGKVGTVLADHQINISRVSSGRDITRKSATNIFNIDGHLPEELAGQLTSDERIRQVLVVDLD